MILLALLGLAASDPAGTAKPVPDDEIVVVAERMKRMRIVARKNRITGAMSCVLKPPSGDPTLDAGVCDIYRVCAPAARTAAEIEGCMRPTLTALVQEWVARRRKARDAGDEPAR